MTPLATSIGVLALVAVHLLAHHLSRLEGVPRNRLLSLSAGVPVAYVFIRILPTLEVDQRALNPALPDELREVRYHIYIVALFGLVAYYGIERVVKRSRMRRRQAGARDKASRGTFWLSITSFALLSAVIGYLMAREDRSADGFALFTFAMGLKFLISDFGLHEDHREEFDGMGRWILIGAVVLGWGVGLATEVPRAGLALLRAFLAGGILFNVIKEEVPQERDSRFLPFAFGTAAYAALLLSV